MTRLQPDDGPPRGNVDRKTSPPPFHEYRVQDLGIVVQNIELETGT
jgi:hypothetical protein